MLTLAQAAERYNLSAQYLRRLAQSGKLKATKVSSRLYLVDAAEVERYVSERRQRETNKETR